jgi:hypothetical protein
MRRELRTRLVVEAFAPNADELLPVLAAASTATTVSLDSCDKARRSVRRGDRAV